MKRIVIFIIILILTIFLLKIIHTEININARIYILNNNNEDIAYINNSHKTNKEDLKNYNKEFIDYVLCIEDKAFYKHNGFDFKRIIKSIFNNIFKGSSEGASTITQQYIKNTYLTNEKSINRKIKEIMLAIKLEKQLSKDEILSEYLSCLYFGNNVYGMTNACKYYFNKAPQNLSKQEMISLIALWNAPSIYSNNLIKWNNKKNSIADILYENNLLTYNELNEIKRDLLLNINKEYINSNRLFYIDQVLNEFNALNIQTEFNSPIYIKTEYNNNTESINSSLDINYSIISTNLDGYITSCIGDKSYYSSSFNIAMNGNRDIGSTIKPLLYYEAIKCGFRNKKYYSEPYTFSYNNDEVSITNSSNNYYSLIGMDKALAVSDNIYAIKTHLNLGMNTLVYHLKKYNISAKPIPSLALGSIGMSLKKLNDIYSQFFNNGIYTNSKFIKALTIQNKSYNYTTKKMHINNPLICNQIKSLLSNTFNPNIPNATGKSISHLLNTKCYGKSGLTDYDSYMIGFNDENLVSVWCGDINNEKLNNSNYKKLPKELFYKTINCLENPGSTNNNN